MDQNNEFSPSYYLTWQAISKESQKTSWMAAGRYLCFWCTMCL